MIYVKVSIPILLYKTFIYSSKNTNIFIGQGVTVPLNNRIVNGYIVQISKTTEYKNKIFSIININKNSLSIGNELIKTINWMSQYYICPIGRVLKTTIPYQLFTDLAVPPLTKKIKITNLKIIINNLFTKLINTIREPETEPDI